jgi:hypothetical protein
MKKIALASHSSSLKVKAADPKTRLVHRILFLVFGDD